MRDNVELVVVEPHAEMITPKHFPNWREAYSALIEECGRVSHKSEHMIGPGTAEPFIERIALKAGHQSILDHGTFTACLVGSRAMSHQLVRHRIAGYTQESQRYCDYSNDGKHPRLGIIVPPSVLGETRAPVPAGTVVGVDGNLSEENRTVVWAKSPTGENVLARYDSRPLIRHFRSCLRDYCDYLEQREDGVPPEDARYLLPNAAKTEVFTTYDFSEWRHVLSVRLDKHAQWEIKGIMQQVYDFLSANGVFVKNLRTKSGEQLAYAEPVTEQ